MCVCIVPADGHRAPYVSPPPKCDFVISSFVRVFVEGWNFLSCCTFLVLDRTFSFSLHHYTCSATKFLRQGGLALAYLSFFWSQMIRELANVPHERMARGIWCRIFRVFSSFPHAPKANQTNPLVLLNLLVLTPNILRLHKPCYATGMDFGAWGNGEWPGFLSYPLSEMTGLVD